MSEDRSQEKAEYMDELALEQAFNNLLELYSNEENKEET